MVHTFQCLGVFVAVDVNSGAVHVLDELTYRLLEQVTPPMEEHCPAEVRDKLPQYDPAALEEAWQELDAGAPASAKQFLKGRDVRG